MRPSCAPISDSCVSALRQSPGNGGAGRGGAGPGPGPGESLSAILVTQALSTKGAAGVMLLDRAGAYDEVMRQSIKAVADQGPPAVREVVYKVLNMHESLRTFVGTAELWVKHVPRPPPNVSFICLVASSSAALLPMRSMMLGSTVRCCCGAVAHITNPLELEARTRCVQQWASIIRHEAQPDAGGGWVGASPPVIPEWCGVLGRPRSRDLETGPSFSPVICGIIVELDMNLDSERVSRVPYGGEHAFFLGSGPKKTERKMVQPFHPRSTVGFMFRCCCIAKKKFVRDSIIFMSRAHWCPRIRFRPPLRKHGPSDPAVPSFLVVFVPVGVCGAECEGTRVWAHCLWGPPGEC